jgi:hypothetical protein
MQAVINAATVAQLFDRFRTGFGMPSSEESAIGEFSVEWDLFGESAATNDHELLLLKTFEPHPSTCTIIGAVSFRRSHCCCLREMSGMESKV